MGAFETAGGVVATLAGVPENIDSERAKQILLAFVGVCFLGVIVVIRTVSRVGMRVALVAALVIAGGALWLQRAELEDCAAQNTCRVFGQDIRVTNP